MHIPAAARRTLQKQVGKENVRYDDISCLLHAYDCSLSRVRPDVVIHVQQANQLAPLVKILSRYRIPFVARAAATNHAGSCAALKGGAILNLAGLNHILEINIKEGYALVEPGVVTEQLQQALAPYGFFYAPDPASQQVCTLGGNVAQNASGSRCLKYGGTLDHVLEISFVLPDGEPLTVSRREAGPDWVGFLTGSEGTFGLITQLKVKILPKPKHIQTFLVTFPSLEECVQTVTDLIARGIVPRCVEAMDQLTAESIEKFAHAGYPLHAPALLILELDGELPRLNREKEKLEQICRDHRAKQFITAKNETERQRIWSGRRAAYAAMARLAPNIQVCDGTVPRSALPSTLRRVRQILQDTQTRASLLFHAGDGNFHPQLIFDERNKLETKRVHQAIKQILETCVDAGGTLSGEHGIGVEKRGLMSYAYDKNTLRLFAQIKQALDPQQLANPLKIIPLNYEEESRDFGPLAPEIQTLCDQLNVARAATNSFFVTGANSTLQTKSSQLSTRLLNRILDIDLANYTVTAQAGVTLAQLHRALKAKHVSCSLPTGKGTLGGAFSSGRFPGFYTQVTGLQALLADGSCVRYGGKLTKNAAGYNLIRLFAGAQGTLGLVTELTFKIKAGEQKALPPKPWQPLQPNSLWKRLKEKLDPQGLWNTPAKEKNK